MHIRSLKIYCDIVRLRSFSKAAELHDISQSNASQVVHGLEEHLGVELIDRSKRPFVVTSEGEHFVEGCRAIVKRYDELEQEVRTLHDAMATRLKVASIYSVGFTQVSQCLQQFLAKYPQADVRFEYLHPERVYEVVEAEEADLGIVSYPTRSRQLHVLPWREETMVVVVPPNHRLAHQRQVDLEQLDGEAFVAPNADLKIRQAIDAEFARRKVDVRIASQFDNLEIIKRFIETGSGVGILPTTIIDREVAIGTLVGIPIVGEPLKRPLALVHRRDRELSETAQRFIELLQRHAGLAPEDSVTSSAADSNAAERTADDNEERHETRESVSFGAAASKRPVLA
jgi:DNA-binding transcriptional LysR family regulator